MSGKYWDKAWSLVDGCTPCSPGCDNCWSAALALRFTGEGMLHVKNRNQWEFNGNIILHPDRLDVPLRRKKPTVYAIWNDLFHEQVPLSFIDDVLDVISACPQHTFLVLTKRAHLIEEKLYDVTPEYGIRNLGGGDYLGNLWLGVTVCNQEEADIKIPLLLKAWPGKKWISIEPMLGPIKNIKLCTDNCDRGFSSSNIIGPCRDCTQGIDAVVLGGETGAHARPMHPDWVRSVRDQCEKAGVPFFLKYLNKKDGRILDGKAYDQLPWVKTYEIF